MPDHAEPVDLKAGSTGKRVDGPAERVKTAKESKTKTILPRPKGLRVTMEAFLKWAATFNEEQKGRALFHVYREYPVIDLLLIGETKPKLVAQYSGKLPFESPNWQEWILKDAVGRLRRLQNPLHRDWRPRLHIDGQVLIGRWRLSADRGPEISGRRPSRQ